MTMKKANQNSYPSAHVISRAGCMKKGLVLFVYLLFVPLIHAQTTTVLITGQITDTQDQAISGCTVALSDSSFLSTTSDDQGQFSLEGDLLTRVFKPSPGVSSMIIRGNDLLVQVRESSARVKISLHDISGKLLSGISDQTLPAGSHILALPETRDVMSQGIVILGIHINGTSHTIKWNWSSQTAFASHTTGSPARKRSAALQEFQPVDIHCDGNEDRQVILDSYEQDLGTIVMQRVNGPIERIGTTEVWDADGANVPIDIPSGTRAGDLLVLALHRTDDDLPLFVDGWTRAAECFKSNNGDEECGTEATCIEWHSNENFCQTFQHGPGHDLAQAIFYRTATSSEPNTLRFDLDNDGSSHVGWIILTTLRNAATIDPVRDWAGESSDDNADSQFPSVYGEAGDMLILSQSFDDFEPESAFTAPNGMDDWGYVGNSDETGYLFGALLTSTGETGVKTTNGPGAANNKDALISLTIKPQ